MSASVRALGQRAAMMGAGPLRVNATTGGHALFGYRQSEAAFAFRLLEG